MRCQKCGHDRWREPLPPRDWRNEWRNYLAHGFTGFTAAAGSLLALVLIHPAGIAIFLWLSPAVYGRQTLEWLRRNDTPGRDLQDHLTGFVAGLYAAAGLLAHLLL